MEKTTRIDGRLAGIVAEMERRHTGRFLSRAHVTNHAARVLGVSSALVRLRLTEECSQRRLVEIRPERDWLVRLPGGDTLKDLYAWRNGDAYVLKPERPVSRGAGQLSFIATPGGLARCRAELRKRYKAPAGRRAGADAYLDAIRTAADDPTLDGDMALDLVTWLPCLTARQAAEEIRRRVADELEDGVLSREQADHSLRHAEHIDPFRRDGERLVLKAGGVEVPADVLAQWRKTR